MNNKNGFFARFTTRRSRLIIWGMIGIVLMSNLEAITDSVLHPEIEYFDSEHVIVGGATALVFGIMFVMVFMYVERFEKTFRNTSQAEEALHASENRFQSLYDNATVGMYRTTPDGRILLLNPAGVRMLGYDSLEEITKRNLEQADFEPGYERIHFHERMKREGTIVGLESVWKKKDGSKIYVRESASAVKDGDGTIIYYDGTFEDITERKQAEETLRLAEEKYRSIFENATVGIFQSASQGFFLNVNPSMARIFGYSSPQEMVEDIKDISAQIYVNVDERNLFVKLLQGNGFIENFEGHNRRKDNSIIWTSTNARCILDVNGNALYYEGFLQDITERKQVEEKIRQLNAELELRVEERTRELTEAQEKLVRQEKLAVLGQMASSVGHELRNPLSVMTSAIYYLKLIQPDADAKIREYLGILDQEVHTSEKIITDLLDFARVKFVDREAVSVSELIRQTLERFPVPASVDVTIEIPSDLPRAYVDVRQIIQVLGNITVNACQAMTGPTGAVSNVGQLLIQTHLQGDMIRMTIQDNGVGISPENMSKLFEPLFTTKAKGIGLGLAVSQKLVDANGGRIEVESEPGKGSSFHVYLPIFKESI